MTTYNEAGLTYDEVGFLYNGLELGAVATLLVNELDVTAELAQGSLAAHVATQGNSLGTLDARLIDPAAMPVVDNAIDLYAGLDRLFRGTAKVVTTDEYRGGHVFVGISAQDAGPSGGVPTAAPFDLSDNPNGTTTFGYESLQVVTRTTEGGTAKSTARVVYVGDGLWAGMNVELTSANNGLSAVEYTIVDATVTWPIKSAPKYVLTLGDPLVKLAQVMAHQALEADVITSTMISDGAISTPKLAANAVTAAKIAAGTITATEIASDAITADEIAAGAITTGKISATTVLPAGVALGIAQTTVSASGLTVNDGTYDRVIAGDTGGDYGLKVVSSDGTTVIIDGTSNMFKIIAGGSLSVSPSGGASGSANTGALTGLGTLATVPGHLSFVSDSNATTGQRNIGVWLEGITSATYVANSSGGAVTQQVNSIRSYAAVDTSLDGSGYCVVRLFADNAGNAGSKTFYAYYHVLKEAAL